mmetsp:Transcript_66350/g.190743  ORF Transcript_66350/g.190743 Transcript_66350/m.190743 type:complete len:187 (+) Transcript_66350:81-641(+)
MAPVCVSRQHRPCPGHAPARTAQAELQQIRNDVLEDVARLLESKVLPLLGQLAHNQAVLDEEVRYSRRPFGAARGAAAAAATAAAAAAVAAAPAFAARDGEGGGGGLRWGAEGLRRPSRRPEPGCMRGAPVEELKQRMQSLLSQQRALEARLEEECIDLEVVLPGVTKPRPRSWMQVTDEVRLGGG